MKYITTHIMGIRLQDMLLAGELYTNVANTTLNELFNVQSGVAVDKGSYPVANCLAIGSGGLTPATAANGKPYMKLGYHKPRSCALVEHVPFRLVLQSEDLSGAEQAQYAMRVARTYNGANYWAYYLRRFDSPQAATSLEEFVQNADGTTTSTPWVPTSDGLHPTISEISDTGTVLTSSDYVTVEKYLGANLGETEIGYLIDAMTIIYGTSDLAVISEAAIVACQLKAVSATATSGGGTTTYTEAVGAIIISSMTCNYHLPSLNDELDLTFEIGGAETLYGAEDGTTVSG